jgi:signal transduction histidine kinase
LTDTLSAREGAGLYLVRRARTLTAPHQLRLLATAFLAVLVVDVGRIYLDRLRVGEQVSWTAAGCLVLSYVAIAVALWRPWAGLCIAGVALAAGLLTGGTGTEPALLLIIGAVTTARGTRRLFWFFVVGATCYLAVNVVMSREHAAFFLGWFGGAVAVGTALGMLGKALRRMRDRAGRHLAEVAAEDARLRSDERRRLASELHDVVTHQLSNTSLQVMSHLDSDDADELRKVLRKVSRSTDSALTELRLLVRVLRDYPVTAGGTDEVAELSQRLAPTLAAAGWARRLTDAGFDPLIEIPAKADRLEMTVQSTITRALDVVCDNVLRHAPERSWCSITLSVNPSQVVLRAASPLAPARADEAVSLGWGLRGLRERVDLTGGVFGAGPSASGLQEPEWVVVVTLPHD